jgi:protein-tyrosine phosphatase
VIGMVGRVRRLLTGALAAPPAGEYDYVAPWLVIGPALPAPAYQELRGLGVTHVIDLRAEGSDDPDSMRQLGFQWTRVPVSDRAAPTHEQLLEIMDWLDRESAAQEPALYLHCSAGQGRAPTVAIALLMHHGVSLPDAHRRVLAARPSARPTEAQDMWLMEVADRVRRGA